MIFLYEASGTETLIASMVFRIYDVNQASYLTRKPASIVKCSENTKKSII